MAEKKKQCETSKLYLWLISWIMSILQFTIWTLAVVVVLFKWRVIFNQYGSKKHAISSVMIYRLSDKTGQLTSVHLAKDRQHAKQSITATHRTVTSLTIKEHGL